MKGQAVTQSWIVQLEAAGDAQSSIDRDSVMRLLFALDSQGDGGMLHSACRYVVQVRTSGSCPGDALLAVLSRWKIGIEELALPAWEIVRAEVLTPKELARDLQNDARDPVQAPGSLADAPGRDRDDVGHELLHRVFCDPLTGLLTREVFSHRLEAALMRTDGQHVTAVVCLGLDAFRSLNNRLGRLLGDEILHRVGRRLVGALRPDDCTGRLGRDVYALLLERTSEEVAVGIAERVIEVLGQPLTVRAHKVTVGASAGIAFCKPGEDADAVLARAEAGLVLAKDAGGGRHAMGPSST